MSETKTVAVCDASELKDGEMKQVEFDDGKVLLSKVQGKIVRYPPFHHIWCG